MLIVLVFVTYFYFIYRTKIQNLKAAGDSFGKRIKKVDKELANAVTAPVECNDSLGKESYEAVTEAEAEAEEEEEEEEDSLEDRSSSSSFLMMALGLAVVVMSPLLNHQSIRG